MISISCQWCITELNNTCRAKNSMRTSVNYRTKLDLDRTINDMHGHCVRPKGVASKRTRNKVFSLAGGKMRYVTGQEAIIKSVA